jgi:hypothetical protein
MSDHENPSHYNLLVLWLSVKCVGQVCVGQVAVGKVDVGQVSATPFL